ncbi:hypothetical protein DBB36_22470 [Flavobacterium sp. WLB]|uniref:hypothetical protein n=1 Tax=unclassified Flavobacterium TaxID=196869 RepID=UPI0006ABBAEC|nr:MULTISPECIES: hypothetical protein [unclassified Flavobacterium]KOP39034.1 hypothetical protein AKO67_05605 [Flavobacterium sp. VMW]OWU89311.1 hypothetical protein APR43_19145 [Flavobacterium sp. NLM]PUU67730.1 hypothetical protein DBB36_22470 [Flavobacterium sp. WLB]
MSNSTQETSLPKIYNTTALIAYIYAALIIVFAIYKQFFYVDKTWFHGFLANGFAVFSTVIWFGILMVFKLFLNRVLKYGKADSLIIISLVFLAIPIYSLGSVLFSSIPIYFAQEEQGFNSLASFASTSISSAILLILSNIVMIVVTILLGNRIRKINVILKDLFMVLGFSLIILGVGSALQAVSIIDSDFIVFLPKAIVAAVLGYILKATSQMNYAELSSTLKVEINENVNLTKAKVSSQKESEKVEKINVSKKKEAITTGPEVVPYVDINELENKELVLSYFDNLSTDELNRLEVVVAKNYTQNLTDDQKKNLIIQYISERKSYDHNRYAPK